MKRTSILLLLIAMVASGVVLYQRLDARAAAPVLQTAAVTRGDVVQTVDATGTLNPVDTVEVGTQVSGTIATLGADYNQTVHRGQVIATLDQALLASQVEQAQATVQRLEADAERARADAEDAVRKRDRARQLAARQLLPQADVDAAEATATSAAAAVKSADAQLAQARAALNQAKVNLSHTVITAPVDGIVLSRKVEIGQTVAAGLQAPTLFVLARSLDALQLQAKVDEADVGHVRDGQPVDFTVDAYPGETFTGTVQQVRLDPTVVQNVVTYTTIIDVPNPGRRLKPGMTATVSIQTARADDTLRVPAAALRYTPAGAVRQAYGVEADAAAGPHVWQLQGERLVAVPVKTALSDGAHVAIASDELREGTRVVTGAMAATVAAPAAADNGGSPLIPNMPRRPRGGAGQSTGGPR